MLTQRYTDAMNYAVALHGQQLRKVSGEPYLRHLIGVSAAVIAHGGDEDEAIAALLHDAVEDQGGMPIAAEIATRFGDRVAAMVLGCSEPVGADRPPWRQRKEAMIAHLAEADAGVCLVKAADLLDNARALLAAYQGLGEAAWSHFRGGRDGTLWYYRTALGVLQRRFEHPIVQTLARQIDRLPK